MARVAVMDEFTSVVDRTVAKVGSAAIAKAVRGRPGRKFVAISCHNDIRDWLEPDWVVDMATCSLARGRLCRPRLEVGVHRCGKELWAMFKRHHYLSGSLPKVCWCYVGVIEGEPVAFAAVACQVGFAGYRRFSRIVVLPDYQGIGVGGRFRDTVAEIEMALPGVKRLGLVTSHPAMIGSLRKSNRWRCSAMGRSNGTATRAGGALPAGRMVVSFVYSAGRGKMHEAVGAGEPGVMGSGDGGNCQG